MLYVCEADSGGIMEYAIRQSAAIAQVGVGVHFLCKPSFPVARLSEGIVVEKFAPETKPRWAVGRLATIWNLTFGQRRNVKRVVRLATQLGQRNSTCDQASVTSDDPGFAGVAVIFACYKEYFAPFWVGSLQKLAQRGVRIGTIAHDPVRDFVVGPRWWHRWSVRLGYSFVSDVFVHDETPVDFGGPKPDRIRVHQLPHGPYEISAPKLGREATRKKHGFTASEADVVSLSFGQIRDGKNLDLFLRAMPRLPENVKLLVAGTGGAASSKPPEFYQKLAQDLGVAGRCSWDLRHIPEEEVGDLFAACDITLLTYSARFRSVSGVLNTAVSARKPVLASSGPGPLKTAVEKYGLGVWVEPDSGEALLRGARSLLANHPKADWEGYLRDNSWERNAEGVIREMGLC